MSKREKLVFSVSAAIGMALFTHQPLRAQTRRLITQPIDEAKLVTLRGNTHPSAQPANDRGPVSDSMQLDNMWLLLKRPAEKEKALVKYLDEQQDPNSPNYHKWITAKQMGDMFGPAPEDIAAVTRWLETSGFKVNHVYPHGILIDF